VEKRNPAEVLRLVKDEGIEIVDVRFVDLPGLMQHFSVPAHQLTADVFEEGFGFDGSSIRGFQEIQESDMLLMPDPNTAVVDPFRTHKTLNLNCFVRDPITLEPYSRDPRYVAQKAEAYLGTTGLADTCYFGPEAEFFIFDDVRYSQDQRSAFYQVDSVEGNWNTAKDEGPNLGYKIRPKEGYFPVPPADHFQDLRSEMILTMERLGIEIEVQHHEVATAGQAEIDMRFDTLLVMADKLMLYKYVVKNVAHAAGYTATFMPKPLFQDNGSGMHCHQSLWKDGKPPVLRRSATAGLSDMGSVVHRRTSEARPGGARLRRSHHQLVQAPGAGLRGAGEPGLLAAQPLGRLPHPAVLGRAPRPSGSSSAAPTLRAIRIWPSRRCSWPVSTACRTRIEPGTRWTRTSHALLRHLEFSGTDNALN
jgi:glutamine synthetase